MSKHYFELRTLPDKPGATIAADIARHLHARQYLGSALVVCDNPFALISAVRKQWMRLSRMVQTQRASTLSAEEILRHTHCIMRMQNMQFVAKPPAHLTDAHVYFVTPDQLQSVPINCYSVYLASPIESEDLQRIVDSMPKSALVVNYDVGLALSPLGLHPKNQLEVAITSELHTVLRFMKKHSIDAYELAEPHASPILQDRALDTLLDVSHEFLQVASIFRHALDLAQPTTTVQAESQRLFDTITRLAYRVQMLSPDTLNGYFIKTFGDKEVYFLRDVAPELYEDIEDTELAQFLAVENVR